MTLPLHTQLTAYVFQAATDFKILHLVAHQHLRYAVGKQASYQHPEVTTGITNACLPVSREYSMVLINVSEDEKDLSAHVHVAPLGEVREVQQVQFKVQSSGKDPDVELSRASEETSEDSRTKGAPILALIRRDYTVELKKEPYGVELLHAVGFVYVSRAKQFLASNQTLFGVGGWLHNVQGKYHVFSETVSTVRAAMDLKNVFEQIQAAEKAGNLSPEDKKRLEDQAAEKVLQTLFKGTKLEIESVLRETCDRILEESSLARNKAQLAAIALQILGEAYMAVKKDDEPRDESEFFEEPWDAASDVSIGYLINLTKKSFVEVLLFLTSLVELVFDRLESCYHTCGQGSDAGH
ncbi:predicted protein [Postia placenta Mad-698-R]|nr:predicted protein [Postia placenta Mad-698-R]